MSWTITPQTKVPVDPYRSQVSLLLHGDGANGSTTITDSSPSPKTVTAVGDAKISTAQSKFGGSSIAFDGNADYALLASNQAFQFGSDNFTLEAWIYPTSFGFYKAIVTNLLASETTWTFTLMADGLLRFQTYNAVIVTTSTGAVTLNTWSHVALTRSGNNFTIFVNGTQQGSSAYSVNFSSLASTTVGGDITSSVYFNGYIDDLRITKGIARYETGTGANAGKMVFTGTNTLALPTAPFPDI